MKKEAVHLRQTSQNAAAVLAFCGKTREQASTIG